MISNKRIFSLWLSLAATILALSCTDASRSSSTFMTKNHVAVRSISSENIFSVTAIRGGAYDDSDDEEYSDDESETESESESEVEEVSISKSVIAAAKKSRKKKTKSVKKAVSASLSKSKPVAAKKVGKSSLLQIPYVLRMFMNPITVLAMTKAYFASLFNINYMDEDPSQTLRSALEHKAKTAVNVGKKKPARKFRPGQAKTLSDLPQLSA